MGEILAPKLQNQIHSKYYSNSTPTTPKEEKDKIYAAIDDMHIPREANRWNWEGKT